MPRFMPTDMAPDEIPGPMREVLDLRYWGGQILGDDSGERPAAPVSNTSRLLAAEALNHSIRMGSLEGTLEAFETGMTFEAGSEFAAAEHEPGTIVLFRKEELVRMRSIGSYANMALLAGTGELPPPSTDLGVDFSVPSLFRGEGQRKSGAGIEYRDRVHLGIVAVDHEDRPRVFAVPNGHANQEFYHPEIVHVSTFNGAGSESAEPLPIGEVQHYSGRKPGDERLERVNILVANTMTQVLERLGRDPAEVEAKLRTADAEKPLLTFMMLGSQLET